MKEITFTWDIISSGTREEFLKECTLNLLFQFDILGVFK